MKKSVIPHFADTHFADTHFADTHFADTQFADTHFADKQYSQTLTCVLTSDVFAFESKSKSKTFPIKSCKISFK